MGGNSEGDNESLLQRYYQTGRFVIDNEDESCREKVNRLRNLMFFIHKYLVSGKIDDLSYTVLHQQLSTEYSMILDSMDEIKGLNNYHAVISPLTSAKRNEAKQWSSSLSADIGRQPECIARILSENKLPLTTALEKHSQKPLLDNHVTKNEEGGHQRNNDFFERKTTSQRSSKLQTQAKLAPIFHGKRKYPDPTSRGECSYLNNEFDKLQRAQLRDVSNSNTNGFNHRQQSYATNRCTSNKDDIEMVSHEKIHPAKTAPVEKKNPFLTAGEQLTIEERKKKQYCGGGGGEQRETISNNYGSNVKKSLGTARRGIHGKFIPPVGQDKNETEPKRAYGASKNNNNDKKDETSSKYEQYEWMKNIDAKMIELIENEIMDHGTKVEWDDIAGLEFAKNTIQEIVIWPMLRPDIFTGLRGPPKGLLLFGPPGTGKTLIGKCIASQSNATFFSISASSLTSKWVGEGEKMVRALFGVARCNQPAVIFIDEIDSLLTQRSDTEHESSRRIKTEFLVQLDGATCVNDERILVVGATNRPQELDEAARRRLVKRLYIPLPVDKARKQIVSKLMCQQANELSEENMQAITNKTDGYSGADMANLCREAALGPIRSIRDIRNINASEVRPVSFQDFDKALKHVRPSVSKHDLLTYIQWNDLYGSGMAQ